MPRTFPVILVPQPEGGFFVDCPSLPGCYSQGDTQEEALANIREAIELVLEDMTETGERPLKIAPPHRHRSADRRMSGLPVVSGRQTITALMRIGYQQVRQRGSHVRLRHPTDPARRPVTVPDHRELKSGTRGRSSVTPA